jgi:hypothetical protein
VLRLSLWLYCLWYHRIEVYILSEWLLSICTYIYFYIPNLLRMEAATQETNIVRHSIQRDRALIVSTDSDSTVGAATPASASMVE